MVDAEGAVLCDHEAVCMSSVAWDRGSVEAMMTMEDCEGGGEIDLMPVSIVVVVTIDGRHGWLSGG